MDVFVTFDLACKACAAATFRITFYLDEPLGPVPASDDECCESGDFHYRPPHDLICCGCGVRAVLFDARTDGYDGRLNGGCSYKSGSGEALESPACRVSVLLGYNTDLDEMIDDAARAGVQPSDLFDWISIAGAPVMGGLEIELSYECG